MHGKKALRVDLKYVGEVLNLWGIVDEQENVFYSATYSKISSIVLSL